MTQPALFISHGAPTTAISPGPTHAFLSNLGTTLDRPCAIIAVSAHWETETPSVSAAQAPATIYDFFGFPEPLYKITYPAPGAPALARQIATALGDAGIPVTVDPNRGLDHGIWVPLHLMFPMADIPVVPVSIQPSRDPAYHYALGRALAPFRKDGALILATGNLTHNLGEFRNHRTAGPNCVPDWVSGFATWMESAITDGRVDDLLAYRHRAPHGLRNHPTDEHLLPLFVALGAGNAGGRGRRLFDAVEFGVLAMDAYAFD